MAIKIEPKSSYHPNDFINQLLYCGYNVRVQYHSRLIEPTRLCENFAIASNSLLKSIGFLVEPDCLLMIFTARIASFLSPAVHLSSCTCPNPPRPRGRSSLQYSFRNVRLFLPCGSTKVWIVEPSRNSVSSFESCTRSSGGGMLISLESLSIWGWVVIGLRLTDNFVNTV
jgi:hypothetical protein